MADTSIPPLKRCKKCGNEYPATTEYWHRHPETLDGLHSWCKHCKSVTYGHKPKEKYPEGFKRCKKCREMKPLNEFHRNSRAADKHDYTCKMCRAQDEGFNYKPPTADGFKRCSVCKRELPATTEYFYQRSDTGRLHSNCIPCYNERMKAQKAKDPERHREQGRLYYRSNKEKHATSVKRWVEKNKDRVLQNRRDWREKNRQRVNELQRQRRHADPERHRTYVRNRRARLKWNGGTHTPNDIEILLRSQSGLCWWCGKKITGSYHVDHRIPVAKGGSNSPENLCISCPKCNQSKGDKYPWEFNGRLL